MGIFDRLKNAAEDAIDHKMSDASSTMNTFFSDVELDPDDPAVAEHPEVLHLFESIAGHGLTKDHIEDEEQ